MTFEFDAEKYKKASTHQKEWGRKLIAELDQPRAEPIEMIRLRNAKASDVLALIDLAREKVMKEFKIKLEMEIEIIGKVM